MNDAHVTRTALLEAARDLFARDGYDGTSIRAITARAAANLGAVTYHFGSKERLYRTVLESFTVPLEASVRQAVASAPTPLEAVEAAVRALFAYLAAHPTWPSLMVHELALGRPLPAEVRQLMRGVAASIGSAIRAGQRSGRIVRGDVHLLTFSVVAQPLYFALVGRRLREVFGIEADDPVMRRRIVEHAVRAVHRSLTPPGRSS